MTEAERQLTVGLVEGALESEAVVEIERQTTPILVEGVLESEGVLETERLHSRIH